ncbi:putative prophage replication P [Escherichia coli DEC6B]|nr:putative prophage replication P [Escherichia coli DEC6B]
MQIIDNMDMSISINAIALNGIANTSAELIEVIEAGELTVKAAGVRVKSLDVIDPAHPMFGFDIQDTAIAGFDNGYWS